jgi:hypothetical protein
MILNAYIDGSGTGDPKFRVLAGWIGAADMWIELSKAWQSRLDCTGIPYFKMNELASRPEIAGIMEQFFFAVALTFALAAGAVTVLTVQLTLAAAQTFTLGGSAP